MSKRIVIKRKDPFRKWEIPILGISFFYFFLFYAMAGGDLKLMFSKLTTLENGLLGLTLAVVGFALSVILNLMQVSRISLNEPYLVASTRLGLRKKYPLDKLTKCRMKWYDTAERRYPFFQFNFADGRMLQITGHQFKGLKPFILALREEFGDQLIEMK